MGTSAEVQSERTTAGRRLAATVLLAVLFSLALASIAARNRMPWSDEGWFSSPAFNLAHKGFFGTTVIETAGTKLTRIDRHTYWVMPLFLLGEALWYKVFPADIFWTRMFSISLAPLVLYAFYAFLARLCRDRTFAASATALFALSFVFIDNTAFARPDVLCCGFGLAGLASYLAVRERSLPRALLVANSFLAASLATHPNALFHFAGLAALVLWMDRGRLNIRSLAAGALPYGVVLGAWALYAAQDPQAFFDQMSVNGANNGRWTPTLNPIAILKNEIVQRYMVAFGLVTRGLAMAKGITLVVYAAALAGVLANRRLRRKEGVPALLLLTGVYFAAMCVFNQKLSYYLVHIVPMYVALLALWVLWLWREWPRLRPAIAAGVLVLVAVETGGILLKARQRSYAAAQRPAIAFLLAHTKPTDRITGSAALIYELGFDDRLRDDVSLGASSHRTPNAIVIDPLYRDYYSLCTPERLRPIREQLSRYEQAYNRDGYEVYLLRR